MTVPEQRMAEAALLLEPAANEQLDGLHPESVRMASEVRVSALAAESRVVRELLRASADLYLAACSHQPVPLRTPWKVLSQ